MAVRELTVEAYRSIRDLRLQLRNINVLTGPNGCGKSNLYHSMFLLAKAATGGLSAAIAQEGGMPSVLWAGPEGRRTSRKSKPKRLALGIRTDDFAYNLQLGLP
ncbi:MAG TPA: recombinase RecF, partial [Bryobacteraceae bacterium]|nr:recombinase RecF [Bryobacteraceae bacterium]